MMTSLVLAPRQSPSRFSVRPPADRCKSSANTQVIEILADWRNLPQDVLLSVVARLRVNPVNPLLTTCKQWRGHLVHIVHRATLSHQPRFASAMNPVRRKSLWLLCPGSEHSCNKALGKSAVC